MNEEKLKNILEKIMVSSPNSYPDDAPSDLLKVTENELIDMGYKYKRVKRKYNKGYLLDIYDDENFLFKFVKGSYPNNSKIGWNICNDKLLTEKFLKMANIKTPDTKIFTENEYDEALEHIKSPSNIKYVIKPTNLMQALGAFLDVTIENFEKSWHDSIAIQKKYKRKEPKILVQNQISGMEVRVIVIEGKVTTATLRGPAYIIGDGKNTIKELIIKRNEERKLNPFLRNNLIKFNDELDYNLAYRNKDLNFVLNDNEYFILYPRTGIAHGREMYEITNLINPNILNQAYEATLAIPGIHTAGVDIIIEDLNSFEGTVIEVNKTPAFQLNYYPEYGDSQRPLSYIFKSLILEHKILNDTLSLENLSEEEHNIISTKYNFLFEKNKRLERILLNLNEQSVHKTSYSELTSIGFKYLYSQGKMLEQFIEEQVNSKK